MTYQHMNKAQENQRKEETKIYHPTKQLSIEEPKKKKRHHPLKLEDSQTTIKNRVRNLTYQYLKTCCFLSLPLPLRGGLDVNH